MRRQNVLKLIVIVGGLSVSYIYAQEMTTHEVKASLQQQATQLKQDTLPLSGIYRWTFHLGPVEQVSTHTFTPQHIDYQMRGKVHSTDYRMQQLSYDAEQKKWIGRTTEGVFYALFFKDISKNSVTLYKHKCKKGLDEAIALQRPADETTADHGWNVYTREGVLERGDTLAFGAIFYDHKNQSFELRDEHATWKNTTYKKLTHHAGERRWVGQYDRRYLVIFYDDVDIDNKRQGKFAFQVVNDIEKAYQLKHDQQTFTTYQVK